MQNSKRYYHDRVALLLLSFNVLVALLISLFLTLKLVNLPSSYYPIIQGRFAEYHQSYTQGTIVSLYSLVVFIMLITFINSFLSIKTYPYKRDYSIIILGLGTLLIVLAYLVSESLISLS